MPAISIRLVFVGAAVLLASVWHSGPPSASAQETLVISGVLANGTAGAPFVPEDVPITLRMLDGAVALEPLRVNPLPDGLFLFPGMEAVEGRVYFLSVEYQGAVYSATPDATEIREPVVLTVYEATADAEVVSATRHTVIVTGADAGDRVVEVLEQVEVVNTSDFTLVPNLSEPGNMGFLRFALPPGSFNLDVRSNLVGGQVLEVDRGFALTMPVPPSRSQPHQMEFIYRLNYEGDSLDLGRSLPFGATTFRMVVPTSVGIAAAPDLTDLGASTVGGREFQFLEGANLERATRLTLRLDGLPQPSLWSRIGSNMGSWYLAAGVPTLMGLVLSAGLALGLLRRRSSRGGTTEDLAAERQRLLDEAVRLESRQQEGKVSQRRYAVERDRLKRALMEIDLEMQMKAMAPSEDLPPPSER